MTLSLGGLCKTQSTKNICNNQIVHTEGSDAPKITGIPAKLYSRGHFSIESAVKLVNKC